jgi:hypothetical protein
MRRTIAAAVLTAGMTATTSFANPDGDELFHREYMQGDHEFISVMIKEGDKPTCNALDISGLPQSQSGVNIIGKAFVETNKTIGYVTWLSMPDHGQVVYFGHYTQTGCIVSETRSQLQNFYGNDVWNRAREAYNSMLKNELEK